MVRYRTIVKTMEEYVEKCATSSKARKRGAEFSFDTINTENIITYSDGTTITLDRKDGTVKSVTIDGKTHNYLGDEAYNNFKEQETKLKNTPAKIPYFQNYNLRGGVMRRTDYETEHDFCKDFSQNFASRSGMDLNKTLYNGEGLKEWAKDTDGRTWDSPIRMTDSKTHVNHFIELEKANPVDHDDYVGVTYKRELHDSENLEKKSYTAKGFTSMTLGGSTEDLKRTFNGTRDSWTVITTIDKGSGIKGMFFGKMISDYRYEKYGEADTDWECELNLPPKTRFTRDLIDENNHIIIQHIESQR